MRIPPPPAAVPSSALLHLPPAAQRLVTFTREAFSENRSKPDSIGGGGSGLRAWFSAFGQKPAMQALEKMGTPRRREKEPMNPDSIGGGKWNPIEPARWGEEESDRGDGFHACVETSEANPYSDDARARVFADLFMA